MGTKIARAALELSIVIVILALVGAAIFSPENNTVLKDPPPPLEETINQRWAVGVVDKQGGTYNQFDMCLEPVVPTTYTCRIMMEYEWTGYTARLGDTLYPSVTAVSFDGTEQYTYYNCYEAFDTGAQPPPGRNIRVFVCDFSFALEDNRPPAVPNKDLPESEQRAGPAGLEL